MEVLLLVLIIIALSGRPAQQAASAPRRSLVEAFRETVQKPEIKFAAAAFIGIMIWTILELNERIDRLTALAGGA